MKRKIMIMLVLTLLFTATMPSLAFATETSDEAIQPRVEWTRERILIHDLRDQVMYSYDGNRKAEYDEQRYDIYQVRVGNPGLRHFEYSEYEITWTGHEWHDASNSWREIVPERKDFSRDRGIIIELMMGLLG